MPEKAKKEKEIPPLQKQIERASLHFITALKRMDAFFEKQQAFNEKTLLAIQGAEDTLLNVLVAIRQNEALQAWYPPQQGHPEMKVVGSHPCSDVSRRKQQLKELDDVEELYPEAEPICN